MKKVLFFSQLLVGVLFLLSACDFGSDQGSPGDGNTGNENTGNENTGNENTGNENTGNENTERKIYFGTVELFSDEQVEEFVKEYKAVEGRLTLTNISTLVTASSLRVTGALSIQHSPLLSSLEGLTELIHGQSLYSLYLGALTNVAGGSLASLNSPEASIQSVDIYNVPFISEDLQYFSRVRLGSLHEVSSFSWRGTDIDSWEHWGFAPLLGTIKVHSSENYNIRDIIAYCALKDWWVNDVIDVGLLYYPDGTASSVQLATLLDLQAACP